jgi:pyruvate dehydrogenase (quinone)
VDLGLVGDIKPTLIALLETLSDKTDRSFLEKHLAETKSFHELLQHYVVKGPGIKPIRPEFLAKTLSDIASDDALFFADTGTACIWLARHISGARDRRGLHDACALGDLLTQVERKMPVVQIILNNDSLDFVQD